MIKRIIWLWPTNSKEFHCGIASPTTNCWYGRDRLMQRTSVQPGGDPYPMSICKGKAERRVWDTSPTHQGQIRPRCWVDRRRVFVQLLRTRWGKKNFVALVEIIKKIENGIQSSRLVSRLCSCLQHITNVVFHDVGLQRFKYSVSFFWTRTRFRTQQVYQEAPVRTSGSLNLEGVIQL